jgi:hypothetical protein
MSHVFLFDVFLCIEFICAKEDIRNMLWPSSIKIKGILFRWCPA